MTGQTEQEARAAARAMAEQEAARIAAVGMTALGQRPDILAAVERAAQRAAARLGDMGEISAETEAGTLDALAAHVGAHGIPADADGAASLVSALAKQSARRAWAAQRKQWAPVVRTARPTEAPNRLEAWAPDKLVRHAQRYSMGALSTVEQARAILDRRAAEPTAVPMVTRTALLTRDTVRGDRVAESVTVGAGMRQPRHGGSTTPSAEATYWRAEHAFVLAESVRSAVGAPTVEALHGAYRMERVRKQNGRGKRRGDLLRNRHVAWGSAAPMGANRGTFLRTVRRDAGSVVALSAAVRGADAGRMVRARQTADAWAAAVADRRAPLYAGRMVVTFAAHVRHAPRPFPFKADLVLSCEERPAVAPNHGVPTPAEEWRARAFGSAVAADVSARMRQFQMGRGMADCLTAEYGR